MDLEEECATERASRYSEFKLLKSDASASEALLDLPPPLPQGTHFRPIHYIGSKLRMLQPIMSALDAADPTGGPVCDLFAGSGTVARNASLTRRVYAVDIQAYARVIASAVIGQARPPIDLSTAVSKSARLAALLEAASDLLTIEEEASIKAENGSPIALCRIVEHGLLLDRSASGRGGDGEFKRAKERTLDNLDRAGLKGAESVCLRHFGGTFFSYKQAIILDSAAAICRNSYPGNDAALASVLTTASSIVNTVGKQFAQPLQPRSKNGEVKTHLVRKMILDRNIDAIAEIQVAVSKYLRLGNPAFDLNIAMQCDYADALDQLRGKISVVYADPPYTRDHYSRFYHVLETIALGDDPDVAMSNIGGGTKLSRGAYRTERHQSDFCIKSKAPAAFSRLFQKVKTLGVPMVLSYSSFDDSVEGRPRVLAISDVISIAKEAFSSVVVQEIATLDHSKMNHDRLNKQNKGTAEVLITCSL